MSKLGKYLNESRIPGDLSAHVQNKIYEAIEEWKKEHLDEVGYWPTRKEDYQKLADDMMDFFEGMKRSVR